MTSQHERHRARHVELHKCLDELVADYLRHQGLGGTTLTDTSVMALMLWSADQMRHPTEPPR